MARKSVTDDFQKFPERLSSLMKERGVTQQDLANALGVKRQTISLYKSGQSTPDAKLLRDLSVFFKISSDYLLGLTDIKTPDVNIKAISEETGLSENCIEILKIIHRTDICADKSGIVKYEFSETINCLVEHEPDFNPIVWIGRYLSVPSIDRTHYITVNGEVKKKNADSSTEKDAFCDISSYAIENAFLREVTTQLIMLKKELNSERDQQDT